MADINSLKKKQNAHLAKNREKIAKRRAAAKRKAEANAKKLDSIEQVKVKNPPILRKPLREDCKFKPEYCQEVLDLMAQGTSIIEIANHFKVDSKTFYDWTQRYPEMAQAVKLGEQASYGWWLEQGRVNIKNRQFNTALWIVNMRNRFGWADKPQEIAISVKNLALEAKAEIANKPVAEVMADPTMQAKLADLYDQLSEGTGSPSRQPAIEAEYEVRD